jgi:hypothetical protein
MRLRNCPQDTSDLRGNACCGSSAFQDSGFGAGSCNPFLNVANEQIGHELRSPKAKSKGLVAIRVSPRRQQSESVFGRRFA